MSGELGYETLNLKLTESSKGEKTVSVQGLAFAVRERNINFRPGRTNIQYCRPKVVNESPENVKSIVFSFLCYFILFVDVSGERGHHQHGRGGGQHRPAQQVHR
jgi:hypothetical protein